MPLNEDSRSDCSGRPPARYPGVKLECGLCRTAAHLPPDSSSLNARKWPDCPSDPRKTDPAPARLLATAKLRANVTPIHKWAKAPQLQIHRSLLTRRSAAAILISGCNLISLAFFRPVPAPRSPPEAGSGAAHAGGGVGQFQRRDLHGDDAYRSHSDLREDVPCPAKPGGSRAGRTLDGRPQTFMTALPNLDAPTSAGPVEAAAVEAAPSVRKTLAAELSPIRPRSTRR
jgi:hypothetical protein